MMGGARISPRFYNCGLLEGKGYRAFIANEYNSSLSSLLTLPWNLLRSGTDVGENLMAVTAVRPLH
jgi:hypothetical protein